MHKKMIKRPRGGFIPAAALAGLAGRAAISWAVPKALNYLSKKRGKKGKGLYNHGSKGPCCKHGKGLYPHGGRGLYPHGGKGLYLHGKQGKGIKQVISRISKNPMVQNLIKRGKQYLKSKVNQAIDDPIGTYHKVRKMVSGKGNKIRTFKVKQRRLPKQRVGVESSQVGRTTAITMSRAFKPSAMAREMSIKQIKKSV